MIYRRKTYKLKPESIQAFNDFFHSYLYPNQIEHGAKLIGRWANYDIGEVLAIWAYESMEHYESIEKQICATDLHQQAKQKKQELGNIIIESHQDFLTSTAEPHRYHHPKHIVSVTAYITNHQDEILLVRNQHRSYTMEMPGGQVEEGETLEEAVHREVEEETGVTIQLKGITGVYQNQSSGVICVVFRGEYVSGTLRPAEGETTEVIFERVTTKNIDQFITKQLQHRTLDAMNPRYIPFESFNSRPFEVISRLEVYSEKEFD